MKEVLARMAVLIGCVTIAACDGKPNILFVADGDAVHLLQLTDAQEDCSWPHRMCYLTAWNGETTRGCWGREQAYVHARFPEQEDRLIPVGDFRATEFAISIDASLDLDPGRR